MSSAARKWPSIVRNRHGTRKLWTPISAGRTPGVYSYLDDVREPANARATDEKRRTKNREQRLPVVHVLNDAARLHSLFFIG